jgi:thioesterase domain-containing protein
MDSLEESPCAATAVATDKRELLRSLLRPVTEATDSRGRLSGSQVRLWEIENYESTPGIHDFSLAYSMQGALDTIALDKAFRAVASRHASLHTRIVNRGGEPQLEEVSLTNPLLEIRAAGADLPRLLAEEAANPLDPMLGRGWRAVLFRVSSERHTLLLHFHHIFVDRWSVVVLIKEVSAAYVAFCEGRQPVLAPAPTHVAEPPVSEGDLVYWKRVFCKTPEPLRLPLTRSTQLFADYSGARLEFEICGTTAQGLKSAAVAQSATLFSALVAAVAAFLHAHTGQEDVVLCTPILGRHRAGTRSAIGYFNNILPMRLDLSGDPDFRSLVRQVALQTSEIFAAQDAPFHRILQLPELAGRRITQCLVALQNLTGLNLEIPGIISSYEDIHNGTANFDVVLFFEERKGKLLCLFDYKSSLLEPARAQLLKGALLKFLDAVVEHPSARLSSLASDFGFGAAKGPEACYLTSGGGYDATQKVAVNGRVAYVAPGNEVEQRLTDIWAELLGIARLGIHDNFFDLGGHSLLAVRALARILEKWPYQHITLAIFIQAPTVAEFAALLQSGKQISTGCMVPYRKSGTNPPFFCLPGGGGNVLYLRGLAAATSNDQPLYCLQAKGLDGSDPLRSVEEAAGFYIREIRTIQPRGPYFIGGASFGGLVAFEMARQLREQGEEIGLLALIDAFNFAYGRTRPKTVQIYENARFFRRRLTYHIKKMRDVPSRDRLHYLVGRTKSARHYLSQLMTVAGGESPNDVPVEGLLQRVGDYAGVMKERLNKVTEASINAARTYRPRYYEGEITLFKASEQYDSPHKDHALGWIPLAKKVHVIEIQGNHTNILSQPRVSSVAEYIEAVTERNRRRSG